MCAFRHRRTFPGVASSTLPPTRSAILRGKYRFMLWSMLNSLNLRDRSVWDRRCRGGGVEGTNTDPGFGVLGYWGLGGSGIRDYGVNFHEREGDGKNVMGSGMSRTGRACSVSSGRGRGIGHHISTKGGTSIEEIRDAHPAFGRQQCAVCSEIRSSHSVRGTEKYMKSHHC